MNKHDLVIIGGGAGGLVVASVAAQLGLDVVLIEKEASLGGDCLHHGCVPSKTLIHSARVASLMRQAERYGLPACEPEIDLAQVNRHVRDVIGRIQVHDDPERFRGYGCEVFFGAARFTGPHEVEVAGQRVHGRRIVIATGSLPFVPPLPGLNKVPFLTNLDIFSLQALPRHLLVLGGGPIGVEMAQAFARLGSRVTLIERESHLLAHEDPELTALLTDAMRDEGIDVLTGSQAVSVSGNESHVSLILDDGQTITGDRLLVASGRRPNVDGLALDAAGVVFDERGIHVDRRMRTSRRHIYALGDVTGPYPFTHMAEYQAGIVISNAVFRFPKKADYRVVPWVTYTDPELARVGITEQQARAQGLDVEVLRFDFADVDRAIVESATRGRYKLVVRKGRVLGASILGPHAGELIHEIALAMQTRATIGDISATIHAYPTLAQAHRRVVNTLYGKKLFGKGTRRLVRWINRLLP